MIHQDQMNQNTLSQCAPLLLSVTSLIDLAHAADCAFFENNSTPECSSNNLPLRKRKSSSFEPRHTSCDRKKIKRTMSRCTKSFVSLARASFVVADQGLSRPVETAPNSGLVESTSVGCNIRSNYSRGAICRSQDDSSCNIPFTISASSCESENTSSTFNSSQSPISPLDISPSDTSISSTLVDPRQSYGWFVETDCSSDDDNGERDDARADADKFDSVDDLAFFAPVAPKGIRFKSAEDDADLAYAVAADTIDDVLGDFF
mmetsp:Transcript_7148/g.8218  ORF Transcript_7148/g.8218 Transcript_7148/m.8218 type:complete len:261 (+) Transcript_7148:85-867(+)